MALAMDAGLRSGRVAVLGLQESASQSNEKSEARQVLLARVSENVGSPRLKSTSWNKTSRRFLGGHGLEEVGVSDKLQRQPKSFSRKRAGRRAGKIQAVLVETQVPSKPESFERASTLLDEVVQSLASERDPRARMKLLLKHAAQLPELPAGQLIRENRVMGCTAQVWVTAQLGEDGLMHFGASSDSEVTKGLCAILVRTLSGLTPEEVLVLPSSALGPLTSALGSALQQPSRINGLHSIFQAMQTRTRLLVEPSAVAPFPSLLVTAEGGIEAQGDFAEAQVQYLQPDSRAVKELTGQLKEKKMGVVAHFYMDPQVQGVLVAAQKDWPHIHISDSLVMADRALTMAAQGCGRIAVLGVDFMAENVRAILDRGGYAHIPVLRMSSQDIGCSLAEAAQSQQYLDYLAEAGQVPRSLHVIYINTSLDTKARAHALLPTITCTSSNVVQTVLQAFAQVPDLTLWYGPDTYMGGNLAEMLRQLAQLSDEEVAAVHPAHTRASIAALLPRLRYFQDGACIVHDLFGRDVVERVRRGYGGAYQTAHFEVPGEMFALAMEARTRGMGTVGSTQNILDFISARTKEAIDRGFDDHLQFVLGTESGMITAIVQRVKRQLAEARANGSTAKVEVEIVFPVDSSAVASTDEAEQDKTGAYPALAELPIVPGVKSGEGCSVSGGCASCPYMKMNSLDALLRVCRRTGTPGEALLAGYAPRTFSHQVAGRSVADIGCEPIVHMRHFQKEGKLSDELVEDILERHKGQVAASC